MSLSQNIQDLAQEGADSVFEYINRTAEMTPEGVRWKTLGMQDDYYYDISVYNGVAGISLFLSDFFRVTGTAKARDLALGANQWCTANEHTVIGKRRGLCDGWTGIGMAWLHAYTAINESSLLTEAYTAADRLIQMDAGPATEFLIGAAGEGIFLIRLWEATRKDAYLEGALKQAQWLESVAKRNEFGVHWPLIVNDATHEPFLGFVHGPAGIGHFFLLLYEATGEPRWSDLCRKIADMLLKRAVPDRGGLNWPQFVHESEATRCQWCHGSPGVGLFFTKAYAVLEEEAYLETAKAAGETTYAYGDVRANPSQCHGLAGNAELFIELAKITGDKTWSERAFEFAQKAFSYEKRVPEGPIWLASESRYGSPDFLTGAAGVGHFFLRLLQSDLRMPLM